MQRKRGRQATSAQGVGSVPAEPDETTRAEVRPHLNDENIEYEHVGAVQDLSDELPSSRANIKIVIGSTSARHNAETTHLDVPGKTRSAFVFFAPGALGAGITGAASEKVAAVAAATHDSFTQHLAQAGIGLAGSMLMAGAVLATIVTKRRKNG